MSFALLLLFLFMLYASPALLFPELEAIRPAQIVAIAAMVVLMIQKAIRKEKLQFQWPDSYLMLMLVGAAGLSCFAALSPKVAVSTTSDLAKIALVYFLIVNVVDSGEKVRTAIVAIVAGGLIPAIGTVSNYVHGHTVEGTHAGWIGTFGNPNDLAYSMVVLIPLTLQLARDSRPRFRLPLWGIVGLFSAAIFASGSRGGLLGLVAVAVVLSVRQAEASPRFVTAALLVATFGGVAVYGDMESGFANLNNTLPAHQRIETIRNALSILMRHPILGVGLGGSPLLGFGGSVKMHNTIIQALSETGLLGFVTFVLLMATGFVHIHRISRDRKNNPDAAEMALGLEASLIGFAVCAMSSGYLVSWFPYILLGLASALSLSSQKITT